MGQRDLFPPSTLHGGSTWLDHWYDCARRKVSPGPEPVGFRSYNPSAPEDPSDWIDAEAGWAS